MKFFRALVSVCLLFGLSSEAQEGVPVYFDYLADNYYLVYPSMAGIGEGAKIRLTARKQWFDVQDAPNLQTLNAHFRTGENGGIGAIVFNDANGFHSQTGLKGTYAHHLKLGGDFRSLNQLSFGISGSMLLSSLDETEFRSVLPDPAISGTKITQSYFNVDLGVSYNIFEFYVHAALLNVLETSRDIYRIGRADDPDDLSVPRVDNLRRFLFSVGHVFGKGKTRIEPSILFQLTQFTEERTVDLNLKLYRDLSDATKIWGGLSYRRSFTGAQFISNGDVGEQRLQLFTPIAGVNLGKWLFSYNYSYQSGDIRFANGGFHQITLGYDIGETTKNRYDCYCPAANY